MKRTTSVSILCRTVAVILLVALTAISVAACANNGGNDTDERGNMKIEFGKDGIIRNGTEYYTYQVEKGRVGVVSVSISKKSGKIDIDVYPAGHKDDAEYTGRDLDSASFSVILNEPGEYKVCITAKDFVGDYGISWKTEESKTETAKIFSSVTLTGVF